MGAGDKPPEGRTSGHPYDRLTPDLILDAVERFGVRCDGRFLALNSYENRVYQVGVEEGEPLVVKFYRPGRWSEAAILEEHDFACTLAGHEIPVIAPLAGAGGHTLFAHAGFRYALYPRRGGRWPELEDPETRLWIGRFLGRIHAVGAVRPFRHRPRLDVASFGHEPVQYLLERGVVPRELATNYHAAATAILERVEAAFAARSPFRAIRLHGDCHPGNILWSPAGPHFVDLDDCRMGPAVQDLWMLLSGTREEMLRQLADVLEGYGDFHAFDAAELPLIEPLRALRMIHYAGWLAKRWDDPAFPLNFPWFNTPRYWQEHLDALREQLERLDEPALELRG